MSKKDIKNSENKKKKKKKKTWKKVVLVILLVLLVAGGVFAYKVHQNGGGTSRNVDYCIKYQKRFK